MGIMISSLQCNKYDYFSLKLVDFCSIIFILGKINIFRMIYSDIFRMEIFIEEWMRSDLIDFVWHNNVRIISFCTTQTNLKINSICKLKLYWDATPYAEYRDDDEILLANWLFDMRCVLKNLFRIIIERAMIEFVLKFRNRWRDRASG